jgi:hypothetical protein
MQGSAARQARILLGRIPILRILLFTMAAALVLFLADTIRNSAGDIWKSRLDSQIEIYIREHPALPPRDVVALRAGRVVRGWNREKCRVAWGEPDEVLHLTRDQTEIWRYDENTQPVALMFTNGFLTGWYP